VRRWSLGDMRRLKRLAPIADAATIAGELGRSVQAVRNRASLMSVPLQKRGVLRHHTNEPHPPELRAQVVAQFEAGATRYQLAQAYCLPWQTVDRWVSR
jgi:hypothetical protein